MRIAVMLSLSALLALPCPAQDADAFRIEAWIRDLASEDFARQGEAAAALEKAGPAAIPQLVQARSSKNAQTARWAATILDRLVPQQNELIDRLIRQLDSRDFADQGKAAEQLTLLGELAVPKLKELEKTDRAQAKEWAARILGRIDASRPVAREAGRKLDRSVLHALLWLARHQQRDGSWSSTNYSGRCGAYEGHAKNGPCEGAAETPNDLGVTGLALLAFTRAGFSVHSKDDYDGIAVGDAVRRAVRWLITRQAGDGSFAQGEAFKVMYGQSIATLAMVEASAAARDGKVWPVDDVRLLRTSAERATGWIVAAQNPGRGWRYTAKSGDNDTSVTAWCLQALAAARKAGIEVPDKSFAMAGAWFDEVSDDWGAGYTHKGTGKVFVPGRNEQFNNHPTMASAAALGKILIDPAAKKGALAEAAEAAVFRDLPTWEKNNIDAYYWYYATAFLGHRRGSLPVGWIDALRKALDPNQESRAGSCDHGSWKAVDRWSFEGGRIYMTAICALSLEYAAGLVKTE